MVKICDLQNGKKWSAEIGQQQASHEQFYLQIQHFEQAQNQNVKDLSRESP